MGPVPEDEASTDGAVPASPAVGPTDVLMRVSADGQVIAVRGDPGTDPARARPSLPAPQPGQPLTSWLLGSLRGGDGGVSGRPDEVVLTVRRHRSGSGLIVRAGRRHPSVPSTADAPGRQPGTLGAPLRLVGYKRRRTFLFDPARALCFELRSGLVHVALEDGESYTTDHSIRDLSARLPASHFFRAHRDVIVNLSRVKEIERAGRGRLRLLLDTPDARGFLVSRPASGRLRRLLRF